MIESRVIIFFVASVPIVVFAFLTILLRNIVHAIVSLILCLISLAVVYIAIDADFIAAAQIAIYVGAISILILFAIMFTRDREGKNMLHIHRQVGIGITIAIALFASICFFFISTVQTESDALPSGQVDANIKTETSITYIGRTMFEKGSPYVIPVEMASIMILAALIGGIELAKKKEDEL
jgi:NADH-quinone oxidoreductase subunit J